MAAAMPFPGAGSPRSGVLVRILRPGNGVRYPKKDDVCVIHYELFLASRDDRPDIKVEDTRERGLPFAFPVGAKRVLPGLDAAVETMSVGQVSEIFIPSWYAYGTTGSPPWIPPGADLLYRDQTAFHGGAIGSVHNVTGVLAAFYGIGAVESACGQF
eukprot:scaffold5215_cov181-Amphora_coffeaeformis.AAC.22